MIPYFTLAQPISGIVNTYYKVEQVFSDHIQMASGSDLSTLHPGDKVVLIQMTGVTMPTLSDFEIQDLDFGTFGDAGNYEMLAVSSVDDDNDQVMVTVTLTPANYELEEKIQLVKIYEAIFKCCI